MILTVMSSHPGADVRPRSRWLIFVKLSASFVAFLCVFNSIRPVSTARDADLGASANRFQLSQQSFLLLRSLQGLLQRSSGGVSYTDISAPHLNIFLSHVEIRIIEKVPVPIL